jgi:hypothetical protein
MSEQVTDNKTVSTPESRTSTRQSNRSQTPVTVFQAFDKRDEQQILRELQGELLEEYVYTANNQGQTVTQLSYPGTKEAARRRGNFEIADWRVDYTSSLVNAVVKIRDLENRCEFLGASSAKIEQPFALTLALNKAERNALNKMLPTKWIAAMIKEFLNRTGTKTAPSGEHAQTDTQSKETGSPTASDLQESDLETVSAPLFSIPAEEVEKLPWKQYKEGHRAAWIFANKAPVRLLELLDKGPVEIEEFTYRFSGPLDDAKKFVSRAPSEKQRIEIVND